MEENKDLFSGNNNPAQSESENSQPANPAVSPAESSAPAASVPPAAPVSPPGNGFDSVDNFLGETPTSPAATNPQVFQPEPAPQPQETKQGNGGQPSAAGDDESRSSSGTITTVIVVIILIALSIWFFNRDKKEPTSPAGENQATQSEASANVIVKDQPEQGQVNVTDNNTGSVNSNEIQSPVNASPLVPAGAEKTKITAYYLNNIKDPGIPDCGRVYPLEREVEKKYDDNLINTARGLLFALTTAEKEQGWSSGIPTGTSLKSISVKNGVARVYLTGTIKNIAGSCQVIATRAQIEKTILRFSYIKSVIICVGDNCNQDEILQP